MMNCVEELSDFKKSILSKTRAWNSEKNKADRKAVQKEYVLMSSYADHVLGFLEDLKKYPGNTHLFQQLQKEVAQCARKGIPKTLDYPEFAQIKVDWKQLQQLTQKVLVQVHRQLC